MSEKGRIDVLVNNAGYGLFGAFDCLMIVYAADVGEMGYFQDTFQNILSSVSFSPTSGGIAINHTIKVMALISMFYCQGIKVIALI